ncbi:MAG: ABC transporter ATP-binding protein [Anaerolineae bacterium]|nr:ABC transporter ATP-binding protein [Gloeobacterales cyanobacterium ES-bin-313]
MILHKVLLVTTKTVSVEVLSLARSYGQRQAVADISFSIAPGEIFGFLGPNGAGKSTTIGMIAGLIAPDHGTVKICGFDIVADRQSAKQRLGLVPQDLALYETLSAEDNLQFWGQMYGLGGVALRKRIGEVLEFVGLVGREKEQVAQYSSGMKRRLNVAAALLHKPEVLLLDEPTVGVDPQSRNRLLEGIAHLKAQGMAILYTSHYLEEAERLCDHVAIVESGRLIALGTPQTLKAKGGGSLRLEVLSGFPDLAEIKKLKAVARVIWQENLLHIESDRPQTIIAAVLSLLQAEGVIIRNLELFEPSLETVFLQLTGKSLRDQ